MASAKQERIPPEERLGFWWEFTCRRGDYGRRLGLEDWHEVVHNALLDEGERNVLDVYFRNQNAPGQFYLGLHSGDLAETATLANVVEPSQAGYARQLIERSTTGWPTLALDTGDYQVESTQESFNAAATWTPVNRAFLASTATGAVGSVILEAALSTTRALVSQDTLQVTLRVKAQ
jgi:hypothetical protein